MSRDQDQFLITPHGLIRIRGSWCNFRDDCLNRNQIMDETSDVGGPIKIFCDSCIKNGRLAKINFNKTFIIKYLGDFYSPMELPYSN